MINNRLSPRAHVVIVDDESITRKLLSNFLKRDAYSIFEAATGQELLDHLDEWRPDVILLDVLMPGMDGYTVCQTLRANATWRHIPIIMITALNRHEEMVKAMRAGADEFLPKPVSGPALLARVQSMVRIKRQHDELRAAIELRDALVDTLVHDMRNSMSIVTLRGQRILRNGDLQENVRTTVESIVQQIERLNTFVTDLSLITQLETGQIRADRRSTDLLSLVREVAESYQAAADARGLALNISATQLEQPVQLDRHLMERLLHGLLSNCLAHSEDNCSITIHTSEFVFQHADEKPCSGVQLVIGDGAATISDAEKEHILGNPMALRNPRTSRQARFGLEVALAGAIMKAHNGRIRLGDNSPKGIKFYLEWPNEA